MAEVENQTEQNLGAQSDANNNMAKVENENSETTGQVEKARDENELILIQDSAFTVKISVPGLEPFDLQVTSMELVQEIHQMLMDKEETCHRTCFSLQLDGQVLDNFTELKSIEGLKDGSVIKVVEEPYTVREVRLHVRHVNDLIHSIDPIDNFNAVNCNSLSYLNDITNGDITDKKNLKSELSDCQPQEYVLPSTKETPICPIHLNGIKTHPPSCLKQLAFSGWNPPPGKRKMKGDLMYLHAITNEDKRYHLTASTRGFYVNLSTDDTFNPKQDNSHKVHHSLVDLLNSLSGSFKKNFCFVQKKRTQKHPFERIGTPFQIFSWLSPEFEHNVDWFRAEDSNASKLGHEDHIPGHSRDWNEEIQATRELPKKSLPERLVRERAMFKVHSDFVNAATRGAIAVVESNIMAINPGEDSKIQMFIWNNMFFSLGFDVKDHYKDFGGDYAAYVAPVSDLQGVKALNLLDIDGLYTLGTVIIDYKGFRVTAQSIIPGILDKDQEQSVVHGSTDFGKTCVTHPKYDELLEKVAGHLRMRPHKVKIDSQDDIVLYSSIECKGIVGNDSRHYVLDLLRMFPSDVNFLPGEDNQEAVGKDFPRHFRHKLCSLRQELVESFIDSKYVQFVKHAAIQIQDMNKAKKAEEAEAKRDKEIDAGEIESAKQLVKDLTSNSVQENSARIIEDACRHVGSWKSSEFDIRFNPNLYQPVVKLADSEELIRSDKKMLGEACDYLVNVQIPLLIKEFLEHGIFVTDGVTLSDTLHSRGINIRYLGYLLDQIKQHETLSYIYSIGVNELVNRCAKRVFRQFVQSVPPLNLSTCVAHFLNCYLSSFVKNSALGQVESAENKVNKKRKKNQNKKRGLPEISNDWANLTQRSLWSLISEEAVAQYKFDIRLDGNDEQAFANLKLRKLSLLRSFCQSNGVQILLREYSFDNKHKETFLDDDVLNMYPVVKHVPTKATDAYNFFTNGQAKIQQGYFKEGFDLISESYNLLTNVYGALHPEICMCLRLLSRLNYILGDYQEALSTQHKAVLMCERLYGVDNAQAITEYSHLALYCFANGQISNSLKLLYRARYLLLINYGEDHPEMSLIDSNLGLILQAAGEYDSALKFLEKALECSKKYFGTRSMKTALSYHLLARLQSCRGDFRTALMNERETYQIYKGLLGEEHERTKESAQVLKHLTEQAVLLQKKLNEMHKGEKVSFPPIQIQQPSLQTVLAMLNIINGIIFLPTHDEEMEKIKEELNKIQQKQLQNNVSVADKKAVASEPTVSVNAQDDDLQ
ncbi:clustered mitochondria -like protein [Brachionus plicatilis]|uniref:Clustered mitochondria protein homolog n=1 Tax=Brachionus plicatilis TaxID=10195 RepID=A0A3M7QAC2_BRAPC|nr:clustered mitochondria -like protein [Brachionus plicatilis]